MFTQVTSLSRVISTQRVFRARNGPVLRCSPPIVDIRPSVGMAGEHAGETPYPTRCGRLVAYYVPSVGNPDPRHHGRCARPGVSYA